MDSLDILSVIATFVDKEDALSFALTSKAFKKSFTKTLVSTFKFRDVNHMMTLVPKKMIVTQDMMEYALESDDEQFLYLFRRYKMLFCDEKTYDEDPSTIDYSEFYNRLIERLVKTGNVMIALHYYPGRFNHIVNSVIKYGMVNDLERIFKFSQNKYYGSYISFALYYDQVECLKYLMSMSTYTHVNMSLAKSGNSFECLKFLYEKGYQLNNNTLNYNVLKCEDIPGFLQNVGSENFLDLLQFLDKKNVIFDKSCVTMAANLNNQDALRFLKIEKGI